MKKFLKYLIIILIIVFIVGVSVYYDSIETPAENGEADDVSFVVSQGEGVKKIGRNLVAKKLIKSQFYFEVYVWQKKLEKKFQAGKYELSTAMNIKDVVRILTSGEVVFDETNITIIEGWSLRDIGHYLEGKGMFQSEELMELSGFPMINYDVNKTFPEPKDYSEDFTFLKDKPKNYGLEGYLFPDTYKIYKDATMEEIILKMLGNFNRKLTPKMREDIEKQGKTIYEIVTLASVIQKEVRSEADMKIVSGIFNNRMQNGQPLQSCASLAYILGVNKPVYSIEDTKIDSSYNTYQKYGLPPGPISNPGLKAIEAAIYPADTDYNYFLSKKENGETVFSKTLGEHNLNKAKYLR